MNGNFSILQRNRVNKEMSNILKYSLTVITAPMGYGKSTAVKNFLSVNEVKHIWISLNEASRSTGYFWTILTQRLSESGTSFEDIIDGSGFPQDKMQTARLIDKILSYKVSDDFILILDDYQFAENDELNILLQSIVKGEIPKLHLVVISRHLPHFDLTELIVKNMAYQIDKKILRFNNTEVQQYFSIMAMPIKKEMVLKIQDIADGWVAALYLIYRGLKCGIHIENITEIQDLIKSAIYEHYDTETKKVLCALSVLDDFTIEMAAYLTGIQSIGDIIAKLHRENAFIQMDAKTRVYTIHNVFRNFIKKESVKLKMNNKEICCRAGYWYIGRNEIDQGFHYLFHGEDYDTMLKELEKPSLYIRQNDRPMMFYYFDEIPKLYKDKHPIACLKFIMLFIITGDKERGCHLLEQFESEMKGKILKNEDQAEIQAAIHLIKMFLLFNDLENMIDHIEAALKLLNGGVSVIASYQGPFSFGSPHLTYLYYKEVGSFKKISEMSYEKYAQVSGGAGYGSNALSSAEYALETGKFDSVEINVHKAVYNAKTKNQTSMVVCAYFTLARLYLYHNKYSEAVDLLKDLSDDVSSNVETILLNTYDLCLGYIYACTCEYDKIPDWIKNGDMSVNSLLIQGAVFSYVVYGKSLILSKNWSKAEALCELFNNYFGIFNNQLGFLHNYIHLSIAAFKRGQIDRSKFWLKEALTIGQADCIITPFGENSANMLELLEYFKKLDGIDVDYLSSVRELCIRYKSVISTLYLSNNPLSSREIEILKLMSKGLSRSEIAQEITISIGTVRTHIQNIYIKLGVNKKSAALNKASKLNLI